MAKKVVDKVRFGLNLLKAVAIVCSPHTFVAKVAEILSALEAVSSQKKR